MLSHANLISSGTASLAPTDLQFEDDWLAYLPMAWIGDAVYTMVVQMIVGFACNCPESPETVQRDLRELGPSAFLAAPRIWENLLTQIQVRASDASWLKRKTYEYFRDQAIEGELMRAAGKPVPAYLRVILAIGEFLVYGPVRDQIGLRRARWCLTGGAPLGADTFRFFRAFGVNLKQVYGSTELSAFVSVQPDSAPTPTRSARPVPGSRCASRTMAKCWCAAPTCSAATTSRKKPRARRSTGKAGSTPGTRGSSTRRATWRSSTAPRTSASSAQVQMPARRSRRSSSRTS